MPMKLWDYILEGCKVTEQCFRTWATVKDWHITHTCAMGAAMVGLRGDTVPTGQYCLDSMYAAWPEYQSFYLIFECPYHDTVRPLRIIPLVSHLNDNHHWSREEIAFWLRDLLEPKETVVKEQEEVLCEV